MKIGFVQYDIQKNVTANISKVSALITESSSDLYVLPELCDSGYLYASKQELQQKACTLDDNEMVTFLSKKSQECNCSFIAGVAERHGKDVYNSAVLIAHGKICGTYRKIHLSDLEKSLFIPGTKNEVFTVDGVTIGIQICFDLWFPEMAREQLLKGADIFCVPANFGSTITHKIAGIRAVENLTPLVLCNRVGQEEDTNIQAYFLGRSSIFNADGGYNRKGVDDIEICMVSEVHLPDKRGNAISNDILSEIRKHYPVMTNS